MRKAEQKKQDLKRASDAAAAARAAMTERESQRRSKEKKEASLSQGATWPKSRVRYGTDPAEKRGPLRHMKHPARGM